MKKSFFKIGASVLALGLAGAACIAGFSQTPIAAHADASTEHADISSAAAVYLSKGTGVETVTIPTDYTSTTVFLTVQFSVMNVDGTSITGAGMSGGGGRRIGFKDATSDLYWIDGTTHSGARGYGASLPGSTTVMTYNIDGLITDASKNLTFYMDDFKADEVVGFTKVLVTDKYYQVVSGTPSGDHQVKNGSDISLATTLPASTSASATYRIRMASSDYGNISGNGGVWERRFYFNGMTSLGNPYWLSPDQASYNTFDPTGLTLPTTVQDIEYSLLWTVPSTQTIPVGVSDFGVGEYILFDQIWISQTYSTTTSTALTIQSYQTAVTGDWVPAVVRFRIALVGSSNQLVSITSDNGDWGRRIDFGGNMYWAVSNPAHDVSGNTSSYPKTGLPGLTDQMFISSAFVVASDGSFPITPYDLLSTERLIVDEFSLDDYDDFTAVTASSALQATFTMTKHWGYTNGVVGMTPDGALLMSRGAYLTVNGLADTGTVFHYGSGVNTYTCYITMSAAAVKGTIVHLGEGRFTTEGNSHAFVTQNDEAFIYDGSAWTMLAGHAAIMKAEYEQNLIRFGCSEFSASDNGKAALEMLMLNRLRVGNSEIVAADADTIDATTNLERYNYFVNYYATKTGTAIVGAQTILNLLSDNSDSLILISALCGSVAIVLVFLFAKKRKGHQA
jgi:hypothetical protein